MAQPGWPSLRKPQQGPDQPPQKGRWPPLQAGQRGGTGQRPRLRVLGQVQPAFWEWPSVRQRGSSGKPGRHGPGCREGKAAQAFPSGGPPEAGEGRCAWAAERSSAGRWQKKDSQVRAGFQELPSFEKAIPGPLGQTAGPVRGTVKARRLRVERVMLPEPEKEKLGPQERLDPGLPVAQCQACQKVSLLRNLAWPASLAGRSRSGGAVLLPAGRPSGGPAGKWASGTAPGRHGKFQTMAGPPVRCAGPHPTLEGQSSPAGLHPRRSSGQSPAAVAAAHRPPSAGCRRNWPPAC